MTRAYAPVSLAEALEILGDPDLRALPVAGCTDLMAADHGAGRVHAAVVDLMRIPELQGIEVRDGVLDLGAAETFSHLGAHEEVRRRAPALAEAAGTIGGWQIQNRATLGGNIANASPAGDALPVLLALDAELTLASAGGVRVIPYATMHRGYRQTALRPGEIIVRVRIPLPAPGAVQLYRKVGTRRAQAISKLCVAFAALRRHGRLTEVRFAAGSVAATPVRLLQAERVVEGQLLGGALAERAAAAAAAEVAPIDDLRSTAAYRRFALGRLVRRMVLRAGDGEPLC